MGTGKATGTVMGTGKGTAEDLYDARSVSGTAPKSAAKLATRGITLNQELFLNCVRSYFADPAARARLEQAKNQEPDWNHIIELASYHGIIPLLHTSLSQTKLAIPDDVERRLTNAFSACAANSLLYAHELAQVQLQDHGIRAIAFKGPALAIQLFGKASLRQCRDLDIVVAEDDVSKALKVLYSSGYRLDAAYVGRADALETDKHLLLVKNESSVNLELHWAIALPYLHLPLRFDTLWDQREEVAVFGTTVAVPSKTDLLIMLCVHGSSHYWTSLKWVCDIVAFLRKYPASDWSQISAKAKKLGCWRMLLVGLSLAKVIIGAEVPAAVEHELMGDTVRNLRDKTHQRILCMRTLSPSRSPDFFERLFTDIRIRERLVDRLLIAATYIRSVIVREIDRGTLAMPRLVLLPVCIFRLVWRSWRTLMSLLARVIGYSRRAPALETVSPNRLY
jgi:hypothetical protein